MVKVKICGITNAKDAALAIDYGADALGFIFYPPSRRYVSPEKAKKITAGLPPFIIKIGVFVDEQPENIRTIVNDCKLDGIQLHGSESPDFCRLFHGPTRVIKSFRLKNKDSVNEISEYQADAFLLDSFHPTLKGGTGTTFDWELAIAAKKFTAPVILSGGLTPENVSEAIRVVAPYAVDVAGGVEASAGKKDPGKMKIFIEQVRQSVN